MVLTKNVTYGILTVSAGKTEKTPNTKKGHEMSFQSVLYQVAVLVSAVFNIEVKLNENSAHCMYDVRVQKDMVRFGYTYRSGKYFVGFVIGDMLDTVIGLESGDMVEKTIHYMNKMIENNTPS